MNQYKLKLSLQENNEYVTSETRHDNRGWRGWRWGTSKAFQLRQHLARNPRPRFPSMFHQTILTKQRKTRLQLQMTKQRKHKAKVWEERQQQANGTKGKRKTNPSLSLSDCDSSGHTVCIHLSLNSWLPMHLLQMEVLFLLSGFRTASHPFCCYICPASYSIRNSNFLMFWNQFLTWWVSGGLSSNSIKNHSLPNYRGFHRTHGAYWNFPYIPQVQRMRESARKYIRTTNFASYMYKQNLGIGLGPMYTNLLINEDCRKGIIYCIHR